MVPAEHPPIRPASWEILVKSMQKHAKTGGFGELLQFFTVQRCLKLAQ